MSTDSWKVSLECEAKDVDCIPLGMYKGVQWYKISSENMRELSDGGSEEVMWFATICDYLSSPVSCVQGPPLRKTN